MSENDNEEKLREVAEILSEAQYIESLLDAEKQLVQAARLVERILKTYFVRDGRGKGLRTLISFRRNRLTEAEFQDLSFAVDIRNRTSHHTAHGKPTDEQMASATKVFLRFVRSHAAIAQRRLAGGRSQSEVPGPAPQEAADVSAEEPIGRADAPPQRERPSYVKDIPTIDRPDLRGTDETPRLSASTLAEHTYCPRAGLLTHEGQHSGPEEEFPSLGRMQWFEPERLEEAYAKACHRVFWMLCGLLTGVAVFVLSPFSTNVLGIAGFIAALGYWVYRFVIEFNDWAALGRQRIEWRFALPCEPDAWSTASQEVDWWGLLQAGFDVEKPVAALEDNDWKLVGKPHRLLLKGDLVIPVHRIRGESGPIKRQHLVRAMAHCHLVAVARAAVSPYAVILFANSTKGVTVSSTLLSNREAFYAAIREARATVLASDNRVREPLAPMPPRPCSDCHHGRPRRAADFVPTMYYGAKLDPKLMEDPSGRRWHSCCGDRFGYKAEHDRASGMRLVDSGAT